MVSDFLISIAMSRRSSARVSKLSTSVGSSSTAHVSKLSVLAESSCALCVQSNSLCLLRPGSRVCDRCQRLKRPCRSATVRSVGVDSLRKHISVIRGELNHILRLLDTASVADLLDAAVDPSCEYLLKSFLSFPANFSSFGRQ